MNIRLNIGCGSKQKDGFIGVDRYHPAAEIKAAAHQLPFDNDSVSEIFTSHMIEHLSPQELSLAFEEWYRVLISSGMLIIRCPNFELYVQEFMEASEQERKTNPWLIRNIFGWQEKGPGMINRGGFTTTSLSHQLESFGFVIQDCRLIETRAKKENVEYREEGDIWCEARKS